MIKGKVFKFGYGDVGVIGYLDGRWCFYNLLESVELNGRSLTSDEIVDDASLICFKPTLKEYYELKSLLGLIEKGTIVKFKYFGYTFDFTNYDEVSVEVVSKTLTYCMRMLLMARAA